MNSVRRLRILLESGKTTFTSRNLENLWDSGPRYTKIIAKRMTDKGLIFRSGRGYYSLNRDINIYELANLIVQPSYLSLHSALFYHNISFQSSNTVTSVSLINHEKKVEKKIFKYFSMKETLFFNLEGIKYKNNISIALPERALLDSLYFGYLPNVDNIEKLNLTYLKKLAVHYPKSVRAKVKKVCGEMA